MEGQRVILAWITPIRERDGLQARLSSYVANDEVILAHIAQPDCYQGVISSKLCH